MPPTILITGAQTSIGQSLIQILHPTFQVIAGLAPGEKTGEEKVKNIELDYENSQTVTEAFEQNSIDYLFLIPS